MLKVLLIRHAQCEMNLVVDERIGGRTNHSPLTPLGEQQARALGAHVRAALAHANVPPGKCLFFSSPAVRAVDTARHVMTALEVEHGALVQDSRILELDQGEWQGLVRKECYNQELVAQFAADPWGLAWNFRPPGGESQRDVEMRMTQYIYNEVLPKLSPGGPPAVVVSHGMAIKCFLRGLLHSLPTMSRNIRLVNTAVTELGFMPRAAGGSKGPGSSNGGVAVHLDSSRGPAEPSLTEAFTPHILRLGDTAHLGFDLQS